MQTSQLSLSLGCVGRLTLEWISPTAGMITPLRHLIVPTAYGGRGSIYSLFRPSVFTIQFHTLINLTSQYPQTHTIVTKPPFTAPCVLSGALLVLWPIAVFPNDAQCHSFMAQGPDNTHRAVNVHHIQHGSQQAVHSDRQGADQFDSHSKHHFTEHSA